MNKQIIKFKATDGQQLERVTPLRDFATGSVNYIHAEFDLSDIWNGYTKIAAVWRINGIKRDTPIDGVNRITIPSELLETKGTLMVNLSASLIENGSVIKRTTSYPVKALTLTTTCFKDWQEPGVITIDK